jgi:opacity protein-like surface antigen
MKKILLGIAIAALFTLTATAAQAIVWPTANPYTCTWTLGSTSGSAFVTFLYAPYNSADITRTGNLRTVYPTGSTVIKPFTLSWDWGSGSDYRFDYFQDTLHCDVLTANAGKDVTFYNCSNGAWQHCVQ